MSWESSGRDSYQISPAATIDPSVTFGPNCRSVKIGHGTRIHRDVYIDVQELEVGDYVTIHHGSVLHGENVQIGHNCWIGHYSILDGHGGLLSIGNNVGIGAQSQLWSHMKFGDVMAGCRWNRLSQLVIEDDVWFVGHCIVSPITAYRRSMLMVGGLATRNMEENRVYAGSPAADVTDRFGPQFDEVSADELERRFLELVAEYSLAGGERASIQLHSGPWPSVPPIDATLFRASTREYLPRYVPEETAFMRFLLYDRAKFLPCSVLG